MASLRNGTFKIKLKSVLATFWGIFCPLFILTSGHTSHRFSRTFTKAQHSTENGHPTSIHWSSLLLWSKNPLAQDASAIGRTLAHTSPHHHHHQCSPINSSLKVFLSPDKRERERERERERDSLRNKEKIEVGLRPSNSLLFPDTFSQTLLSLFLSLYFLLSVWQELAKFRQFGHF